MKTTQLIILFITIHSAIAIFLHKQVESNSIFCISDDIPKHTLVKVDIKSSGEFKFQFKEGQLPVYATDLNNMYFTRSFTTQRYGTHNFCFINVGGNRSTIAIQLAIGKHANDFGSSVGGDDLIGALTNQARIAQDFIQDIVKENTQGMQIIVHESSSASNTGGYKLFTVVFAIATVFLTFLQYKVIKKHLHARKYI